MGTRGAFGVIIGEEEKIGYNQLDSYPEGKGVENLRWLRNANVPIIRKQARDARLVGDNVKPTPEDIAALKAATDLSVSEQSTDDWYCLTRGTHGDIGAMLECGYIHDWHTFPLDSLYCEWAYIVDIDKEVFEVYSGFQRTLPLAGRWAGRPTPEEDAARYAAHLDYAKKVGREPWEKPVAEFKAVELVAWWKFDNLPSDEEFLGLFRLLRAREVLKLADEYPDDLAQLVLEIEEEKLAESDADWQQIYDEALTKISPSDVARVRARA